MTVLPNDIFFECLMDGTLVEHKFVCDGIEHCADGSDENACKFINTGKFRRTSSETQHVFPIYHITLYM